MKKRLLLIVLFVLFSASAFAMPTSSNGKYYMDDGSTYTMNGINYFMIGNRWPTGINTEAEYNQWADDFFKDMDGYDGAACPEPGQYPSALGPGEHVGVVHWRELYTSRRAHRRDISQVL
ncbi:MAG: hypothetical protein ABIC95_00545 [archaeon]